MQLTAPDLPAFYLWGDLLSEQPSARLRRAALPLLLHSAPAIEARKFWPDPHEQPDTGREYDLTDGARRFKVRSRASDTEIETIRRAAADTVPARSPVLVLGSGESDAMIRASLPDAGVIVRATEAPNDAASLRALATELARHAPRAEARRTPANAVSTGATTRFSTVIEWCERDAPELLLVCFAKTFARDAAMLTIATTNHFAGAEEAAHEIVARAARAAGHAAPHVDIVSADGDPRRLLDVTDVFVHATRGDDGAALLREAMLRALPIVATVCGDKRHWLGVEGVAYPVAGREHGKRFEPDSADLCRKLRTVATDRLSARTTGLRARRRALRHPRLPRRSASLMSGRARLLFEGPVFEASSYGGITRNLARLLIARDRIDVALRTRTEPQRDPKLDTDLLARTNRPDSEFDLCLRSGWPPVAEPPPAASWLQRFDWEYGTLPIDVATTLSNGPDRILVHSRHVRDTLLGAGIPLSKIVVVPHGIDPQNFRPDRKPLAEIRETIGPRYAFLFVGAAIWRKGIDVLLSAWVDAFGPSDPVCLLVRPARNAAYAGQGMETMLRKLAARSDIAPVHVLERELMDDEMGRLYCSVDALVHPYRGEGFGMPVLEAQACGRAVIVTEGGATDDFVDPRVAHRIAATKKRVELPEPCAGLPWIFEPDRDALVEALRAAAQRRDTDMTELAAAATRRKWTWERAAATLELDALEAAGHRAR